jgi:hypothetical protein
MFKVDAESGTSGPTQQRYEDDQAKEYPQDVVELFTFCWRSVGS